MLRVNVPMAMKLAFNGLKDSKYKTRETDIEDVGGFETIELSVMLCNDEFICKLNKEWRGEDHPTDVLSMSQHVPELKLPVVSQRERERVVMFSFTQYGYQIGIKLIYTLLVV